MRLHALRFLVAAGLFRTVISNSLRNLGNLSHAAGHGNRRDLGGLFGGFDSGDQDPGTGEDNIPEQVSAHPIGTSSKTDSNPFDIFSIPATASQTSKTKETSSLDTATGTLTSLSPSVTSSTTTTSTTSLPTESHGSGALSTSSSGGSTWKIIGVAVISFSAVAAILIAAVFFDYWWRFVRDLFWKHRAPDSVEEMVPDWEKASWEVRFGDDRHRYPSFTSMPVATAAQSHLQREGSTKVKEWTKNKRLSGGASTFGTTLTTAERTVLSPHFPANPDNVYLTPNPRPTSGNANPFLDRSHTPTLVDAPGTTPYAENAPLAPIAHLRKQAEDQNSFAEVPKSPTSADAYGGIGGI